MTIDRAEVHLHYVFRGEPWKVITWGENSVMEHRFAGISGMTMDQARDKSMRDHLTAFGDNLRKMLS